MIPDRSMSARKTNLTMLRYQEAPMIPEPTNRNKTAMHEAQIGLPTPGKLPAKSAKKAEGEKTPYKRPSRAKNLPRAPSLTKGDAIRAFHAPRLAAEIESAFGKGPITVRELSAHLGTSEESAGVKMNKWKRFGLVQTVGHVQRPVHPGREASRMMAYKLWGKV